MQPDSLEALCVEYYVCTSKHDGNRGRWGCTKDKSLLHNKSECQYIAKGVVSSDEMLDTFGCRLYRGWVNRCAHPCGYMISSDLAILDTMYATCRRLRSRMHVCV